MANNTIGTLLYKITGDTSGLDKNLKKSDKEVKGLGKTLGKFGNFIKGAAVAGAITFAAKKAFELGKAFISSASDFEETQNKFNVVFRDLKDESEDAAKSLEEDFGLSSTAAKTLLSDTGDLLTGFGFTQESALDLSTQVNELAVDLASFTNFSGGAEGASQALTKALLGERESVKALGISILDADVKAKVLEQTQAGLTFETERQAKANATLAIALEQSKNAIGDFERSSDSFANQQRQSQAAVEDLKVALGEGLLPVATESLSIFTQLTEQLTEFTKEINTIKGENQSLSDSYKGITVDFEAAAEAQKRVIEEQKASLQILINSGSITEEQAAQQIQLSEQILESLERRSTAQKKAVLDQENNRKAIADTIEEEQRLSKAQDDAAKLLEERRLDRLTDDELQIDMLQQQIDKWVEFREVTGVQELLNELIQERNELLEKGVEITEDQITWDDLQNDRMLSNLNKLAAVREENAARNKELSDEVIENNEEQKISYEDLAEVGIGSLTSGFASLGEALVAGELQFADFGRLALNVLADVLQALGAQLAAQAALLFFGFIPDIGRGFGALGASSAALLASGIVRGLAGSFENGGIVPGNSFTGDNMVANVNSEEMILNRQQQARLFQMANGSGGSGTTRVIVNLSGKPILDAVAKASKNGTMIIDSRSVK